MARQLNGEDDINNELIQEKASDILKGMEDMETHIKILRGTEYVKSTTNNLKNEDLLFRTNGLTVKNRQQEEEAEKGKDTNIKEFDWKEDYNYDGESKNTVLPFRTIDVIFNKKNIYLNMQNPNPVGILYDIYSKEKWFPILRVQDGNSYKLWKQDVPAFYSFRNFLPLYSDDELETMKKNILKSLNMSIRSVRMQKNLNSKFSRVYIY